MNVLYSKSSLKYLSKLQTEVQKSIVTAVDRLPESGDIKKMRGRAIKHLYRLRVGRFRILFIREEAVIKVVDIDTRGDIYK
jgi:mRNA-degrading endonuclease RelE of RelBE toxin-antitoxin system